MLAASALLSWYLAHFANYDATYGSLGAGIGLMMWMWISSILILFGSAAARLAFVVGVGQCQPVVVTHNEVAVVFDVPQRFYPPLFY